MKTLLFIFLICSLSTTAQEPIFPEKDGKVSYSEIVSVDSSVTKNDLFIAARKWFANTYKSANDVIQMQDKEAGEIIGKGIVKTIYKIPLNPSVVVSVYHTVSITVKDGRYKYEITDLTGRYYSPGSSIGTSYIPGSNNEFVYDNTIAKFNKKNTAQMNKDVNMKIRAIIKSLKEAMSKAKGGSADW